MIKNLLSIFVSSRNRKKDIVPKVEKPFNRYMYTLLSTVGRIALTLITSIIIPKAIGPRSMGIIAFGQTIVTTIRGLFDFNIGSTFFNLSVAKHQSGGLTRLFARIIFIQILLTVLILGILCVTKSGNNIIQSTPFSVLIFLLGIEWAVYLTSLANQLGDSKGISKWPQILILIFNLILTVVIVGLAMMKSLTVYTFLSTTFVFNFLSFLSVIVFLYQTNYDAIWLKVDKENLKYLLKTTLKVSIPLTIASYYGMGIEFFERFLIQYKYGPEEQSYYYIAAKWAAIIIVLSSSSVQIFWQSLVKNIAEGDIKKAGEIYLRLDGLLFYFILCLALTWSFLGKEMLALLLGKDFANAGSILMVMAFYPVSQVFGQMGTTVAVASGRSRQFMFVSIITATVGLIVSYFLLVPRSSFIPGLELGSFGLAIKTAIYGLIAVQPITYLNCRYLSISYPKMIFQKIKVFLILFSILYLLSTIGNLLLPYVALVIVSMVKATIFVIVAVMLLFKKPAFCGVSESDLDRIKDNSLFKRVENLYQR